MPIKPIKTNPRVVIRDSIKKREKNENFGIISNKITDIILPKDKRIHKEVLPVIYIHIK